MNEIEKMADEAWKSTETLSPYSKEVFIQGYRLGFEAGVRKMIDREVDKVLKNFAVKTYGKDDLSPIERNVLEDYIKYKAKEGGKQ
jgi:hypothetical protein